ncbi:alpha/beta fold hydrolase [Candidatus Sumerlaeota bacterium]|nr:alpha/beta fold hydrolase [Candidatus Sumerlaeota bacterium]
MKNEPSVSDDRILPRSSLRKGVRRVAVMLVIIILGLFLAVAIFLFFYQRRMIYFPRRYEPSYKLGLPPEAIEIEYRASSGRQVCFYIPPKTNPSAPPQSLWIFFGGNASLALDWLVYQDTIFPPSLGILLVDYPGYGLCEGKPEYKTIGESSDAAFQTLAQYLKVEPKILEQDLNILGHSLGTAASLQFAEKHPVKKAILLAPFSSLLDMARQTVGWPLCHLLLDRYDNVRALGRIVSTNPYSVIHIFHGKADDMVPFSMGKNLADLYPDNVAFHPHEGVDHNFIIEAAADKIGEIMMRVDISKSNDQKTRINVQ